MATPAKRLLGKVEYMSPEQARFGETDCRSDLFSLGIVLHEVLTGHRLFWVDDVDETLKAVQHKEIPDPRAYNADIPEELALIVMKALQRDLLQRYQTAGQMGFDLEHYMYHDRFGPTNLALAEYLQEHFGGPPGGGDPADAPASERRVHPGAETQRLDRA